MDKSEKCLHINLEFRCWNMTRIFRSHFSKRRFSTLYIFTSLIPEIAAMMHRILREMKRIRNVRQARTTDSLVRISRSITRTSLGNFNAHGGFSSGIRQSAVPENSLYEPFVHSYCKEACVTEECSSFVQSLFDRPFFRHDEITRRNQYKNLRNDIVAWFNNVKSDFVTRHDGFFYSIIFE